MEGKQPAVVVLGMFDGVHIGHRALLARARQIAARERAVCAVDTFREHPAEVLGGGVRLLSDAAERKALLFEAGADVVRMQTFDRARAAESPERFIAAELAAWDVRAFVVGYNYTFGARAAGTADTLAALGARHGFSVTVAAPTLYGGEPVSSTRIRALIEAGDVATASEMLAAPKRAYALSGTVVENRRIGRRIGFPTANILPPADRVTPMDGVYGALVEIDGEGRAYPAVTNVGTNPTVGGTVRGVESHLLGFDGDIYGRTIRVSFLFHIRGEITFPDVQALSAQIALDEAAVRARLGDRPTECGA